MSRVGSSCLIADCFILVPSLLSLGFTGVGFLPSISFTLNHVLKGLSPNRAENQDVRVWIRREHNSVHAQSRLPLC